MPKKKGSEDPFSFHCLGDVPLVLSLLYRLSLVIVLLSLSKGDLDLGKASLDIASDGNERIAFPVDGLDKLQDLALVEKKLPCPCRLMGENLVVPLIERNVHVQEKSLSLPDRDIAIVEGAMSCAKGLDFGTDELDSAFLEIGKEIR